MERKFYKHSAGENLEEYSNKRHFSTFDLLCEANSLWVCERFGLLVNVAYVQNLTHELNYRLGFVEGRGRH